MVDRPCELVLPRRLCMNTSRNLQFINNFDRTQFGVKSLPQSCEILVNFLNAYLSSSPHPSPSAVLVHNFPPPYATCLPPSPVYNTVVLFFLQSADWTERISVLTGARLGAPVVNAKQPLFATTSILGKNYGLRSIPQVSGSDRAALPRSGIPTVLRPL